ncbi:D-2-hydroxyacid dehydrogenase [Shewanella sp. UCD-KL12]|uniref:D-2-hydroxyacid dehydrogenase n=1 Tax=Shewanella sp. UCD-KL12 TaxID=1917163 RepID=UPI0009710FB0|nr:D-2-hydroxyacid dehydrogenase [Shewanella sp. UCD-KL12]
MKLVVLDSFTLNPGDLSWERLKEIGDLHCYDRTPAELTVPRSSEAGIVFTNKTVLDSQVLNALPKLKYIGVLATGTNVVDLEAARKRGIVVTNVPAYGPDAVAQMVFAHILHHTQKLALHHDAVIQGTWSQCDDFCFTLSPLQSLKGKCIGLIGYGAIGQRVANIALAFGMSVKVNTRSKQIQLPCGVEWCERGLLFELADIVSLHCPLSVSTENLIDGDTLKLMKASALLINTARGGLIDELALALALEKGEIAGAGVDVLSTEPPQADNPLLGAKNISISPHNSWATIEARQKLLDIACDNLAHFLSAQRNVQDKCNNQVN